MLDDLLAKFYETGFNLDLPNGPKAGLREGFALHPNVACLFGPDEPTSIQARGTDLLH